ncbi:MAG TPA: GNAT family N-acetyltransferase [Candidatus Limnocylindrales bacterium]|nr:GNAT family N-acetyltransferase [Candidatus Limnocylindrales bacterium]
MKNATGRSPTDGQLYLRGVATLVASWEAYARGAAGTVHHLPGAVAAVFPSGPERLVFNNAVVEGRLRAPRRAEAIDAIRSAYASAGVASYAVWVHERDSALQHDLERRGFILESSTRAMGMSLDGISPPRPAVELGRPDWSAYLRSIGAPAGLMEGVDRDAFRVLIARLDGEDVAAAAAFDHGSDRGIYNVTTVERARRRGLATALTTLLVDDARARGQETASLQSTPMAERVYRAVGFRDLGRILEFVPSGHSPEEVEPPATVTAAAAQAR